VPALSFSQEAGGLVEGVVSPGPTATLSTLVTAGSILIASVAVNVSGSFLGRYLGLTVSDNNGNTWRQLGSLVTEPSLDALGWAFFWVASANSGSTQAQAQLTCTTGSNTCSIAAAEFVKTAGTWEALNGWGQPRSGTNPASPVTGPTFVPPGKPCLFVASGVGTRVDFAESDTGLNALTTRVPTAYRHCTSYVVEPQQVTPGYTWTGSDFVILGAAQIINNAKVGDYPVQLAGRGANR
jgi:hypothetical protein